MKKTKVSFPYGKGHLDYEFGDELIGVLTSGIHGYRPEKDEDALVREAMEHPVGSKTLGELAAGKKNVVIIASDHTRPVPSRVILPPMLRQIRAAAPEAVITILVATGCHRGTTAEELEAKFGREIVERERIVVHDCDDAENLVHIGTLPSGGACLVNALAARADLLLAEGFIEPHFFAGFSGGRKSVLPGVCGRRTVLENHCAEFIASPYARTGVLENNPIHRDMVWAARKIGLAYIVNVVLNDRKEVVYAVAGDPVAAHERGAAFLDGLCRCVPVPGDIVITTNGGYPLDQNAYQAVKGMCAAEAAVKPGGVIIMLARCADGLGGDAFYRQLADGDPEQTMRTFLARGRSETQPDQWQTQILLRILRRARVIFVSELEDATVRAMHMTPAHGVGEALALAKEMLGTERPDVVAIPDGVSVIV